MIEIRNWHMEGRLPTFRCPSCDQWLLGNDGSSHGVRPAGYIFHAVRCPSCGWIDYVQLIGWTGEEILHRFTVKTVHD